MGKEPYLQQQSGGEKGLAHLAIEAIPILPNDREANYTNFRTCIPWWDLPLTSCVLYVHDNML